LVFPLYIWIAGGYIVIQIDDMIWIICLLRLIGCLYCSIMLLSALSNNQSGTKERTVYGCAGCHVTRHFLPAQRNQMTGIRYRARARLGTCPSPIVSRLSAHRVLTISLPTTPLDPTGGTIGGEDVHVDIEA